MTWFWTFCDWIQGNVIEQRVNHMFPKSKLGKKKSLLVEVRGNFRGQMRWSTWFRRTTLRICSCVSDSSDVSLSRLTCDTRYRWVFSWVTGRGRNHDDTAAEGEGGWGRGEENVGNTWWEAADTERYMSYLRQWGETEFGIAFPWFAPRLWITNTGCFPESFQNMLLVQNPLEQRTIPVGGC